MEAMLTDRNVHDMCAHLMYLAERRPDRSITVYALSDVDVLLHTSIHTT